MQQYFDKVKSMKHQMTDIKLNNLTNNALNLLKKFIVTDQKAAARKMFVNLQALQKEQNLIDLGIDQFIYKEDLDDYIENVASKAVKITKLENYTRIIPDELITKIEKTKEIFTDYFVVFTDYTGREERKVATEERNKDPILLGAFIMEKNRDIDFVERMYYIGDWEDEYCDLTMDRLVEEYKEVRGYSPLKDIKLPETAEEALMMFEDPQDDEN